jgi:hypothetical protein
MNHFQGNPKRHILTFVPKDGEKGYFMVHHGGIGVISGVHSYSFDTASLTPFPVFVNYEFLADVDLSKLPSEQMRYDAETKTWIPNHSWNDFAFGFSDEEGRWEIMYGREERHEE